jgi:protein subunit release factor A
MFEKLKGVEDRFHELEAAVVRSEGGQDRDAYQKYIREHSEISPVIVRLSGSSNGSTGNWMTALNCYGMTIPK